MRDTAERKPSRKDSGETGAIYTRLVRDDRISHGAFRLWHYLRGRMNKQTGTAWPEQRTIAAEMHCKIHSIKGWVSELVEAGYVGVAARGQNHLNEYRFLDFVLPKGATRGTSRVAQNGTVALPETAMPRVSQKGNGTNYREPISLTNGSVRERWKIEKDVESVKSQIERERRNTGFWKDQLGVRHPNAQPTAEAQTQIAKLKTRLSELETELNDAI